MSQPILNSDLTPKEGPLENEKDLRIFSLGL